MANWTTPRTWTNGEIVTDTMLNTHLRDNLLYLYSRVGNAKIWWLYGLDNDPWPIPTGDLQYRPIDFANDQAQLFFTLTEQYSTVLVALSCTVKGAPGGTMTFAARLDGTVTAEGQSEDGGWTGCHGITFLWPFSAIGSGTHYAQVLFKHNGGALNPGIGTRYMVVLAVPEQS